MASLRKTHAPLVCHVCGLTLTWVHRESTPDILHNFTPSALRVQTELSEGPNGRRLRLKCPCGADHVLRVARLLDLIRDAPTRARISTRYAFC